MEYGFGKCKKCKRVIALSCFRQWSGGAGLFRSPRCQSCEAGIEERESASLRNPAYHANTAIIKAAKAKPCADCGQTFPSVCMDFDHRPGEVKAVNLSAARSLKPATINAEIAKCDVVCACCHRIRTAKRGYVGTGRNSAKP